MSIVELGGYRDACDQLSASREALTTRLQGVLGETALLVATRPFLARVTVPTQFGGRSTQLRRSGHDFPEEPTEYTGSVASVWSYNCWEKGRGIDVPVVVLDFEAPLRHPELGADVHAYFFSVDTIIGDVQILGRE